MQAIMMYDCATWWSAAITHINKLQALQNKVLTMFIITPWFGRNAQIYRDLNILTIQVFI